MAWRVVDVMPRRDGPENLRILKRRQLGIRPLKVQLGFLPLGHVVEYSGVKVWVEFSSVEACGRILQISTGRDKLRS